MATQRTYPLLAINLGGFDLGEADKVLYLFSPQKGLRKAVAKGVRKPKTKMSGRADPLCVNELLLASGKTFEVITEARTVESFPLLRNDFERLSYALYYAEVTRAFAAGLEEESESYFHYLLSAIHLQSMQAAHPLWLCMEFIMKLLDYSGYRPELTYCIGCRTAATEYNLCRFNIDLGGVVCTACFRGGRQRIKEADQGQDLDQGELAGGLHLTALVWKNLVLSAESKVSDAARNIISAGEVPQPAVAPGRNIQQSWLAAERLLRSYAEHRAGKKFKALDVLASWPIDHYCEPAKN